MKNSDKSVRTISRAGEEEKDLPSFVETSTVKSGDNNSISNVTINFSAQDQYLYQVVQNMVDDVCLFHAR